MSFTFAILSASLTSFASRLNAHYYFNATANQGPVTVHDDNDADTKNNARNRVLACRMVCDPE